MHTKWTVEKSKALNRYIVSIKEPFRVIAVVRESEDAEANAKRIVQAVNSFDGLLEVSKMIVAENLANYEALGELAFAIDYIANKAKQASAQAETKC